MLSKLLATSCLLALALANTPEEPSNTGKSEKRRQYIAPLAGPRFLAAPAPVIAAPAIPVMQPAVVAPVGQCPGGPSLPIECDPKRPWPQCPPQSYCYATNSVDIGPYFCCPIWSTYGAAWRPATPFYNYMPPMPANWPEAFRAAAAWPAAAVGYPVKARKPITTESEEEKKEDKIESSISAWMERQSRA
ncbi:hypothetical protein WR25_13217 isoform A [Diploscapter pachys]|uniref:Uncharacterized protein n=1 Tax=Diploscapter pachys TaxID=2018661 RepID=A0A2A2L5I4_9BILA|nr:hypothetical protein WR25_13217 isoform A [Diploscapter pachys]